MLSCMGQIRGRVTANNSEAVLVMARRGLGIALLADWLVERDLDKEVLVSLLEGYRAPPAPIYAPTPATRYASPAVRALIDHIAASLAPRVDVARARRRDRAVISRAS